MRSMPRRLAVLSILLATVGVARATDVPITGLKLIGAPGASIESTLVSIDGSLVRAVGMAALLIGGVLLSAAVRRWRSNRRLTLRSVAQLRRTAL